MDAASIPWRLSLPPSNMGAHKGSCGLTKAAKTKRMTVACNAELQEYLKNMRTSETMTNCPSLGSFSVAIRSSMPWHPICKRTAKISAAATR